MKKMIEVDIPDGYHIGSVNICPDTPNLSRLNSYNSDFKELRLPTEDIVRPIMDRLNYLISRGDENGGELKQIWNALSEVATIFDKLKGGEE